MSLPKEYVDEINVLNREVVKKQPQDVIQFCANYFNARLEEHRKQLLTAKSSTLARIDEGASSGSGDGSAFSSFNVHSFTGDPTSPAAMEHKQTHHPDDPMSAPAATRAPQFPPAVIARTFPTNFNANRRTSVSAESLTPHSFEGAASPKLPDKTLPADQLARLNASVSKNFLFSNLDEDSLHVLLHALQEKRVPNRTTIIQQGDEGDFFYIVESGSVDFFVDGEKISSGGVGSSFGELALMYNAPRAATVVASSDTVLWALDRITFKKILLDKTTKKRSMYGEFLRSVPVLKVLDNYQLSKLADALNSAVYEPGSVVIREGDTGDEFYIIEAGEARVEKEGEGTVSSLSKGDYFGEVALLHDMPRQATVIAISKLKVASLGRSGFQRLLGPVVDILKKQDPTSANN
jgi:cAMP-dependent protein kinase regulator